ncbi:unnamed protein product [Linum trigynum]|uniref:Protein kinase domain-containing protein n=1 Tax=Linum trigynum TaxID=586398 RepID=A0AAV2CCE7_9ROSI
MEWSRGPVIGRGSTATVSLATSAGQLFALKSAELSRSLFLQREQSILSNLSCPYIVKYVGSGVSDENRTPIYNLCMEYAAGGTLSDVIRRRGGRMGETEIGAVVLRVLKGLDYLHGKGLVHCDIKAQNVLVDEVEGAIIGDFGCSKFVVEGGEGVVGFSGTPAFMAPEVARGEEQGFAADVWAVGCTVIEMATGRNPWAEFGDDPVSALYRIGFSNEAPEVPSWLSEEAADFVAKCLMKNPRERWSAKELLDHPFLHESELDLSVDEFKKEAGTSSPSCVLDQGFWDSLDGGLDSPQNLTIDEVRCSKIPPGDRIKSLISGFSSASNLCSEEEGDWITVRSNESEETDGMFLDDESSVEEQDAASPFWDTAILNLDQGEELGRSDSDEESSPAAGLDFDSIENVVVTISSRGDDYDGFVVVKEVDENSNINDTSDSLKKSCLIDPSLPLTCIISFPVRTNQANSCKQDKPNMPNFGIVPEESHYYVTLNTTIID